MNEKIALAKAKINAQRNREERQVSWARDLPNRDPIGFGSFGSSSLNINAPEFIPSRYRRIPTASQLLRSSIVDPVDLEVSEEEELDESIDY